LSLLELELLLQSIVYLRFVSLNLLFCSFVPFLVAIELYVDKIR
jgi:hypothetical protein